MLYDSIYITFQKRQTYQDKGQISVGRTGDGGKDWLQREFGVLELFLPN